MKRSLLFLLVCACLLSAPMARAQASGPALETKTDKLNAALHCPQAFTDADHVPVLLVHGTFTDDGYNWNWNYLPALRNLGFDVCTVTLPDNSLSDMQIQAEYVVHAVRTMAARSGERVSMIGASQGTLHPRWVVKWWPDVRESTEEIIQLAAPNHGTDLAAAAATMGNCFASCWQMATGSNYITALNEGDETPGDISYTSLYTLTDELVQPQVPTSTSLLDGATNIALQDLCPSRPVDHVSISTGDAVGFALALDALTHPGAADPARFDITTCAQPTIPGTSPADLFTTQGSAKFDGEYTESEPPLKAYAAGAAAGSGDPDGGTNGASSGGGSDDQENEAAPATTQDETAVGGLDVQAGAPLPATGADIARMFAAGLVLVVAGLTAIRASIRVAGRSAAGRPHPSGNGRGRT